MKSLFTPTELLQAYRKFKAWAYYESTSQFLMLRIADYESDGNLKVKFQKLCEALNKGDIQEYLKDIGYYLLPKTINADDKTDEKKDSEGFYLYNNSQATSSNLVIKEDKFNFLIDAAIEVHLISVLWNMHVGVYLQSEETEKYCYGNILCVDREEGSDKNGKRLETGVRMFQRYFDKYTNWRDNGIKTAKHIVEHTKNNALLVSLDVKRFYPTSDIDFNLLGKDCEEVIVQAFDGNKSKADDALNKCRALNGFIAEIFKQYNMVIQSDENSLPIGLPCSGVIANWYLSEFDRNVLTQFTPAYYGRYVDDIFMVVSNVPDKVDVKVWWDGKCKEESSALKTREFVAGSLDKKRYYEILNGLQINSEKLKLFFFSPDYPLALLDNFQKEIEENSSVFWLLPEEAEDKPENFDNASYEIDYEDSIFSIRSIKGIRLSKFRLSVFLARKIRQLLVTGDDDKSLTEFIFKTFKGHVILDFYGMWEKLFSYFAISGNYKGMKKLRQIIEKTIDEMNVQTISDLANENMPVMLKKYLYACLCMALALNKKMIEKVSDIKGDEIDKLRRAYLVRSQYLPVSAILYYPQTIGIENLSSAHVALDIIKSFAESDLNVMVDDKFRQVIPRHVNLHEICFMEMLKELAIYDREEGSGQSQNLFNRPSYISRCMYVYHMLNYAFRDCRIGQAGNDKTTIDNQIELSAFDLQIGKPEIEVCEGLKVRCGLSNIKVSDKAVLEKIKGKRSILSVRKRKRYFSFLNDVSKEKVQCLILPECYLPIEWLPIYANDAGKKRRLTVTGLEHTVVNGYCFNIAVAMIPFQFPDKPINEVLLLPRLKNYYSPEEERQILLHRNKIPHNLKPKYDLIKWNGVRYTLFNCFELANITHRSIFKSLIDVMLAVEYNQDTNYYSNIVESTCRDLHCYFIQSNTSDYGDSRIVVPQKTERMNIVRVKGGENDTVLTAELDIEKLRYFQSQNPLYQQKEEKTFKPVPPEFEPNVEKKDKRFFHYEVKIEKHASGN